MAILGNCELFDFLFWEVENQELADYVRKSIAANTGSSNLPFKITASGNKVTYEGGAADCLDAVYDSAEDEGCYSSYNELYMYYSDEDRMWYIKKIMLHFIEIKNKFTDVFATLDLNILSETLFGKEIEIAYNGSIDDSFPVYQWKILNPISCNELYEDDECLSNITEGFKKIKEHLQQFEGLHNSGNIELNIEINDDEMVFTWFDDQEGFFDDLDETLDYFNTFPEHINGLLLNTNYCNDYCDLECFLNNRTNTMEYIIWSIDEAVNDFSDSPYENFDLNKIKEMIKDDQTVIVKYEYASYSSD